ncbi:MAG: lantibiotic dehydratase [Candidatus Rhabdochlamydia sp.]
MTDSKGFSPAGFFMLRSPLLSAEYFIEVCSKKTPNQVLCEYFSDPLVQEAVLLASPSLYFSLQKDRQENNSISEKKFFSLLRYLIRMSTRSTPFGLCSAVSFGVIGQETQIFFDANKRNKLARPNMQWLYEVIHTLESDMQILQNCKIKANSPIVCYANRLFLLCGKDWEKVSYNEKSGSPKQVVILNYSYK